MMKEAKLVQIDLLELGTIFNFNANHFKAEQEIVIYNLSKY